MNTIDPGQSQKPRSLLYPPTTMQPVEASSINEATASFNFTFNLQARQAGVVKLGLQPAKRAL